MATNVLNHPLQQSDSKEISDEDNGEKACLLQTSASVSTAPGDSARSSDWRRGLDHCETAPVGLYGDVLIDDHEIKYSRSLTEKESPPFHNLKLDRLSEREKQKLIVELVRIQNDGTVEVDIDNGTPVPELLEFQQTKGQSTITYEKSFADSFRSIPRLKIAILVVGTRGDVQPFLAMAKRLQEFGHHVRLATHENFCSFVRSAGVEFYPLGGDPRELAGYMARNKGLIPSGPGEISKQRKQLKAIIESLLPACTEPDMETAASFRAQAIIANPPAYGHVHVAEALGVPIHIFFTMPWTPTHEFPHPLARVPQSAAYWLSYIVVDLMVWWSIRTYINDFRKRELNLAPIAYFSTYHGSISHLPTGYMWSPHVVPKPSDWGPLVDVVGYCFLNLGSKYQPCEEFSQWIERGSPPIYIGFGSMPLDDPKQTMDIILETLRDTEQRGIVDRGWAGLGNLAEVPENVFLLEDCPHDWLFPQCSAVVRWLWIFNCPTTIVPFFGDQFFWGDRIHEKGLGPAPIPIAQLSVENLSNSIGFMLQPEVKSQVMELAKVLENEDGVAAAVDAFHRHLPPELPLPQSLPEKKNDGDRPDLLQWFFIQIGKKCCLPCGGV
uniref:Sterol glycosyltransferase n=1 Tax=Arabis alpina TaxID=50452 RepID=A0A097ZQN6_ARAAL|nr:sterol glycosyltransferase [Arabis alpina]